MKWYPLVGRSLLAIPLLVIATSIRWPAEWTRALRSRGCSLTAQRTRLPAAKGGGVGEAPSCLTTPVGPFFTMLTAKGAPLSPSRVPTSAGWPPPCGWKTV